MSKFIIAIVSSIVSVTTLTHAQSGELNIQVSPAPNSAPTPQERLPRPINLACEGMRVIEWRSSPRLPVTTEFSTQGIQEMNRICEMAIRRYPAFMRSSGLKFSPAPIDVEISLLPANTVIDGKEPRNLNDNLGRFKTVQPNCCAWGIWDAPTHALFLRNDPIYFGKNSSSPNKYFDRVMIHEMNHILITYYNVRALNHIGRVRDEELAEQFAGFMGFTFETDSSAQDYDIKFHAMSQFIEH